MIGGGLCGLSAAIRLAKLGVAVELFEAAPAPGGRTRSFFDANTRQWVDNGPHLLSGAYTETMALLSEAGVAHNVTWQDALSLPLWDARRGHFLLNPSPNLPLALSLPLACTRLPGHGWHDIPALLRLAVLLRRPVDRQATVNEWLREARIPDSLLHDMLEPLCLGAMNRGLADANAASFAAVLNNAFAGHASARLGWLQGPMSRSMIDPLVNLARQHGVRMHTGCRVRALRACGHGFELDTPAGRQVFEAGILALPLRAAQKALGMPVAASTRRISNVHMWFAGLPPLPHPFIGGLGTRGQWFFDVSQQMGGESDLRHVCAVISDDDGSLCGEALMSQLCSELSRLLDHDQPAPRHWRVVSEHHATTCVADAGNKPAWQRLLPPGLVDACEAPQPGDYPATIEYAVARGAKAARQCFTQWIR